MIGAVVSAPHTGTHFVIEEVVRRFYGDGVRPAGASSTNAYDWVWFHAVPDREALPGYHHAQYGMRAMMQHFMVEGPAAERFKILVPLRDAVLAVLSQVARSHAGRGYQMGVDGHLEIFERIATWRHLPHVHYVCVDQPRPDEGERVCAFLGRGDPNAIVFDPPEIPTIWNPSRRNVELKRRYHEDGEVPDSVVPVVDRLRRSAPLRSLYAAHGYALPWMEA